MKFVIRRMSKINESNFENIYQSCQNSSSTWLIAHGIYVYILSSTLTFLIISIFEMVDFFRFVFSCRNAQLQDDENREVFQSHFDFFGRLVSRQLTMTCFYVLASSIFHWLMSDTPISSMMVTRWYIEAIVDAPFFVSLIIFYYGTLMGFRFNHFDLKIFTKRLFLTKIIHFCFSRYREFDLQSNFNTLLICVFRFFCVAHHYFHLNNHSIAAFLSELLFVAKDIRKSLQ